MYSSNELGCVEIGLVYNNFNGTNEINERAIKTTKMMRNFRWKMANEYEINPVEINHVLMICIQQLVHDSSLKQFVLNNVLFSGPHMKSSIMTFKHGFISLAHTSNCVEMPTSIKEIPRLFPRVLRIAYNLATAISYLDKVCEDQEEFDHQLYFFPPSFEPTKSSSSRKRGNLNGSSLKHNLTYHLLTVIINYHLHLLLPLSPHTIITYSFFTSYCHYYVFYHLLTYYCYP